MTGTIVRFYGGGPADGDSRPVPDSIRIVCFSRLMISRNQHGEMELYEDAKFAHAYVKMHDGSFAYDGIRMIEKGMPAQLLVMTRSI